MSVWVRRRPLAAGAIATLTLAHLLAWLGGPVLRACGLWLLAAGLPGALLAALLLRDDALDGVARVTLAVALGLGAMVAGGYALQAIPGPLSRWMALVAFSVLDVALWAVWAKLALTPPPPTSATLSRVAGEGASARVRGGKTKRELWLLLGLIVLAAALRLMWLGYAEFQGDEVAVIHRAAAAVQGRDDALFLHKKGPAEILIPMLTYAVAHRLNEPLARLPFALANLGGLLGVYAIGRSFLGRRAGAWALALLAVNGFFVAFGRIVQYQSLVLLWSAGGLLSALWFARTGRWRYGWVSAALLALGLLAHSDAAFAALASVAVVLTAPGLRRGGWRGSAHLAGAALLAAALLASFYLPFSRHPFFQVARAYIGARTGSPPIDNLPHLVEIGTVYNAIYYLVALSLGLVVAGLGRLRGLAGLGWAGPVIGLALLVSAWLGRATWQADGHSWVGMAYFAVAVGALAASGASGAWRAAWLWCLTPFLAYCFLFADPRTHLYILFPGAALVVGALLHAAGERLGRWRWASGGIGAAAVAVAGVYAVIAFVSHTPEYQRIYPAGRLAFFWAPYGDEMPEQGLFGFPYRAGWKAIGALYARGVLQGDYGTNEETHITRWYTRSAPNCDSNPRYWLIAQDVQDEQDYPAHELGDAYLLVGRVWVGSKPKLAIWERTPARLTYADYHVEDLAPFFDRQVAGLGYDPGLPRLFSLEGMQVVRAARFGGAIELVGYTVDGGPARPGTTPVVTLYWRAREAIPNSYTAFVHIEGVGALWGQKDSVPACGSEPTNTWHASAIMMDSHPVLIDPSTPTGSYALVVGMYDLNTGERLPVLDAAGAPTGETAITLQTIEVGQP